MYETPQDWSAGNGVVFYYRAAQAGLLFDIDLYAGPSENRETYLYTVEAPAESVGGWIPMELRWEDFHRADWEENAGAPFARANQVTGLAFGLNTLPDAPNAGSLWVDDLSILGMAGAAADISPAAEQPTAPEQPRRRLLPCGGATALPLSLILVFSLLKRKRE